MKILSKIKGMLIGTMALGLIFTIGTKNIYATENEITQVKNTIIEDAKTINLDNYSTVTAKPVADLVAKIEIMNTASKNALDLLTKEYNESSVNKCSRIESSNY